VDGVICPSTVTSNGSSKSYSGFDGQYIGGSWRPGKHGGKNIDADPYSEETLAEIAMANANDLDEVYLSAARTQEKWVALLPEERTAVMLRCASKAKERRNL